MNLLAFELATEACSVALSCDGVLLVRHEIAPRRHAELALPWADALLAEAGIGKTGLDALAVGIGPGAFTGVRLAISLVQGIALALDRPVLPVSTLAALAQPFVAEGPVLAAIDARMGELYLGEFTADADGLPQAIGAETLRPADARAASARSSARIGVGSGFAASDWADALTPALVRIDLKALPSAAAVARIALRDLRAGGGVAPERVEPRYLRDKVALTSAEQASARSKRDT